MRLITQRIILQLVVETGHVVVATYLVTINRVNLKVQYHNDEQ